MTSSSTGTKRAASENSRLLWPRSTWSDSLLCWSGARRKHAAVVPEEMPVRGKPGKPTPGFPPFPPPLEIAAAIPTFPQVRLLLP